MWAPAVAAAAIAAMAVSIAAILFVVYTLLRSIDAVREWWGGNAH